MAVVIATPVPVPREIKTKARMAGRAFRESAEERNELQYGFGVGLPD
jgi:hypothetical protein